MTWAPSRIRMAHIIDRVEPFLIDGTKKAIMEHKSDILNLLKAYKAVDEDFMPYSRFSDKGYTKNCVVSNGRGDYNIIIMSWGIGQSSEFHGHENSNCFVKILAGQLLEQQVAYPSTSSNDNGDDEPLAVKETILDTNDTSYIDDSIGIHKMINSSSNNTPAVSLHIYTPAYLKCRIFPRPNGEQCSVSSSFKFEESKVVDVFNW